MASLFTPAHLHLALNHVPIIGLSVAMLPVIVGILFHSRGSLVSGFLAVLLCAGTMPAIMETGEAAREAFVDGTAQPPLDDAGNAAFHQHAGRARLAAPFVYASGILALVALLALIRFPRQAAWIGWAVLAGCLLSIILSVWAAEAGGRIRHAEFRATLPSVQPSPLPSLTPAAIPGLSVPASPMTPAASSMETPSAPGGDATPVRN